MKWLVLQLVTALAMMAIGIVLGRIWEAKAKARSKMRVSARNAEAKHSVLTDLSATP